MPAALNEVNGRLVDYQGKELSSLDPAKPPTRPIPHMSFPVVLYKHPAKPFAKVEHRNAMHEVVDVELVPTEHQTKVVSCQDHVNGSAIDVRTNTEKKCAECEAELKSALEAGWVREPYIPKAPKDPNADVYKK